MNSLILHAAVRISSTTIRNMQAMIMIVTFTLCKSSVALCIDTACFPNAS